MLKSDTHSPIGRHADGKRAIETTHDSGMLVWTGKQHIFDRIAVIISNFAFEYSGLLRPRRQHAAKKQDNEGGECSKSHLRFLNAHK